LPAAPDDDPLVLADDDPLDDDPPGETPDDEPSREPPSVPAVEALPPQDAPAIMRKMAAVTETGPACRGCANGRGMRQMAVRTPTRRARVRSGSLDSAFGAAIEPPRESLQ
jgi:hypothetical protein